MFNRILVPLDGSALAERALAAAERLASACAARIRLVFVHQPVPVSALPPDIAGTAAGYDRYARAMEETYLRETARGLRERTRLDVTRVLLDGPVGRTLAAEVESFEADLVVMTTHGRGAVSRFWMGSIADELVRTLDVPVLLVRAETIFDRMPRRVLVPLDGSERSESALDFAVRLARLGGGSVELLQVVPPLVPVLLDSSPASSALAPPAGGDDLLRSSAAEYLESRAAWVRADGIETSVTVVTDSSPARAIVDTAERDGADLIAIATHGASGLRRLVLGSVTDKVLRSSTRPLLVFRPVARSKRRPATEATEEALAL